MRKVNPFTIILILTATWLLAVQSVSYAQDTLLKHPANGTEQQAKKSTERAATHNTKTAKSDADPNSSIKISVHKDLFSLDARGADLREVHNALSKASGVPITSGDLDKSSPIIISVSFKNLPFDKAIKTVAEQLPAGGYALAEEGGEAKRVFVITKKGQDSTKITKVSGKGKAQKVATDSQGSNSGIGANTNKQAQLPKHVPDQLLIKFSLGATKQEVQSIVRPIKGRLVGDKDDPLIKLGYYYE